jgi:eukaryotic-like serine/threonine-protein kinase
MGRVYDALDQRLDEHIALKTLHADLLQDREALARFNREIQMARKVTHPNVCRIFDLGVHEFAGLPPKGFPRELPFLTMELLSGEMLAEKLARSGAMTTREARPIVAQMGNALAAAHEVGVIHLDFKSANVMLVPGPAGQRAVVTDFGLARMHAAEASQSGRFAGTVAYAAPETARGESTGPSADIYALGVVMFEMVTGSVPISAATPLETLKKKVEQSAPRARSLVPDLDPEWDEVIARCLDRDPSKRFASAREVVARLAPNEGAVPVRRHGLLLTAGLAAVAIALGIAYFRQLHAPPPATAGRRVVAVLPFENATGNSDEEWISTALPEVVSIELAAGPGLRLVDGSAVARMMRELKLSPSSTYPGDTLKRISANLGADLVVAGGLEEPHGPAGDATLSVLLTDANSSSPLSTVHETGAASQIVSLAASAGNELRPPLGLPPLGSAEAAATRAALPGKVESARLYGQGLARLRSHDNLGATAILQKLVASDGTARAHSLLAEAWAQAGYDSRARDEAKSAFQLSAPLGREEHLVLEARYRQATGEVDRAIDIYRALFTLHPDDPEIGIDLARAQRNRGLFEDAARTLLALREATGGRDDPQIAYEEEEVAIGRGDYPKVMEIADHAAPQAEQRGQRLLAAQIRLEEATALRRRNQFDRARSLATDARQVFANTGDSNGEALATNIIAATELDRGNLTSAKATLQQALALFRQTGSASGVSDTLNNLAGVAYSQADYAEAEARYREAQTVLREVGNLAREALVADNLGAVLRVKGDLEGAGKAFSDALEMARQTGDKHRLAYVLSDRAELLSSMDDVAQARSGFREAIEIRDRLEEHRNAGYSRLGLAELETREGHRDEALALIEKAEKDFAGDVSGLASCANDRTEAYLAAGDLKAARRSLEQAQQIAKTAEDENLKQLISMTAARLHARGGTAEEIGASRKELSAILTKAQQQGATDVVLGVRAAAGELEQSENRAAGRQALLTVRAEANAKGYKSIAKEVDAALRRGP